MDFSLSLDTQHRIRYADTDQMGVVYYGNYAVFYEIGRTELMRSLGISYSEIEKNGVFMPVIELNSKYLKPLLYDDVITIRTLLPEIPSASITYHHEIYNSQGILCNRGLVKLGFLNRETLKPIRIPEMLLKTMLAHTKHP
jgi:acyl-CoA thioester hydrolase